MTSTRRKSESVKTLCRIVRQQVLGAQFVADLPKRLVECWEGRRVIYFPPVSVEI